MKLRLALPHVAATTWLRCRRPHSTLMKLKRALRHTVPMVKQLGRRCSCFAVQRRRAELSGDHVCCQGLIEQSFRVKVLGASPPVAASSRLVVGSDSDGRLLLPAERALAEERRMLRRSGAPLPVLRVAVAARGASTFGGPLLAACGAGSGLAPSAACRLMTLSRRGPCLEWYHASIIRDPPLKDREPADDGRQIVAAWKRASFRTCTHITSDWLDAQKRVVPAEGPHLRVLLRRRRRSRRVRQRPERKVELRRGAAQAQRLAVVDLRRAALAGAVPQRHLTLWQTVVSRAWDKPQPAHWLSEAALRSSDTYVTAAHRTLLTQRHHSCKSRSTRNKHTLQEIAKVAKRFALTAERWDGGRRRTCLAPLKMRASHLLLCGCQRTPRYFEDAEALRVQTRRRWAKLSFGEPCLGCVLRPTVFVSESSMSCGGSQQHAVDGVASHVQLVMLATCEKCSLGPSGCATLPICDDRRRRHHARDEFLGSLRRRPCPAAALGRACNPARAAADLEVRPRVGTAQLNHRPVVCSRCIFFGVEEAKVMDLHGAHEAFAMQPGLSHGTTLVMIDIADLHWRHTHANLLTSLVHSPAGTAAHGRRHTTRQACRQQQ